MSACATVHVVDDDDSFRTAVTRLLRFAGFQVKSYASGEEFMGQVTPEMRGCVVADLLMPGLSGLDLQSALQEAGILLPVILLSGQATIPASVRAMRQGAVDFLEKLAPKEELIAAVQRGLDRDLSGAADREQGQALRERFASLSEREREVLGHVVRGRMNKEIAMDLEIHERTVKLHRAAIMTKLQAQSVAELVLLWIKDPGRTASSETA